MSISVELPADLEAEVQRNLDLDQRLILFLRDQVEYHQWRNRRYSEKARALVAEGIGHAENAKSAGVTRAELFDDLIAVLAKLDPRS